MATACGERKTGEADTPARPAATDTEASAVSGESWYGKVALPGGNELVFSVIFDAKDAARAAVSVPMQGVDRAPAKNVTGRGDTRAFTLVVPPMPEAQAARFEFTLARDGDVAHGTFSQAGSTLPVRMAREGVDIPDVYRPQTPVGPFPYDMRDVRIESKDGATLGGTLTIPRRKGQHPVALLITGSGPQDRDETIFRHKPFAVIADHLTRGGVAVLRLDDRGVGASTGASDSITSESLATDVMTSVEWLRKQADINPAQVGLVGHSEGGLIAAMVAAQDKRIAFVVSLAGTGISGRALMPLQYTAINRTSGVSDKAITAIMPSYSAALDAAMADDKTKAEAAYAGLMDAIEKHADGGLREQLDAVGRDTLLGQITSMLSSAWFKGFLALDPAPRWENVICPILALNGERDVQVPAKENLKAISEAAKRGGNVRVLARELPGLNHLFQRAKTGAVAEYAALAETFSPDALKIVGSWIAGQVTLAGQ